jgi:hypothetical protein
MMGRVWNSIRGRFSESRYSLDIWHGCLSLSRQYLRGWNINKRSEAKKMKKELLGKLDGLDKIAEVRPLDGNFWKERYLVEGELEQIYHKEELHWQQRGGEKWLLIGDTNTEYFYTCVNGWRRKTRIISLDIEEGAITEQGAISKHVVDFYKQLFGSSRTMSYSWHRVLAQ